MAAIIGGAAIAAGAQLIGGALSSRSASKQAHLQKQFAKKGIQWRVADAKKAGLHPLYALGAQTPQYSPVQDSLGESLAAAGQNIGSAVSARMTPIQKRVVELELAQAEANLNKTYEEQAFIRSERLRNIQGQFQWLPEPNVKESGSTGTVFGGQAIPLSTPVPPNYVTPKAPDLPSGSGVPGVMAGTPPAMREFHWPGIGPILLPGGVSGDASEALESVSESLPTLLAVLKANKDRYGAKKAQDLINLFTGGLWYWSGRNVGSFAKYNPFARARGAR